MKPTNPAFPITDENVWEGLTIREYFAGQALIGAMVLTDRASEVDRDGQRVFWEERAGCMAIKFTAVLIKELAKSGS